MPDTFAASRVRDTPGSVIIPPRVLESPLSASWRKRVVNKNVRIFTFISACLACQEHFTSLKKKSHFRKWETRLSSHRRPAGVALRTSYNSINLKNMAELRRFAKYSWRKRKAEFIEALLF
jgi:hypothetical protein